MGPAHMLYFRIAVFAVIAASNIWRLASGSLSGGWRLVSVAVLAISLGAIVVLLKQARARRPKM